MATQQQEADRFAAELLWCITQLETGLKTQTPSSRQEQEAMKTLKILRSTKAPMIKKRQVMRNAFGDYRKKMKAGEKKSLSAMKHSRFQNSAHCKSHSKSRFLRQSHTKQGVLSQGAEWTSLDSNLSQLSLVAEGVSPQGEERLIANSVNSENSSLPSTSGDKGKGLFTFVPSDNSFVFAFQNGESDNADALPSSQDNGIKDHESFPTTTTGVSVSDDNNLTDDDKLHKNYYKFEKSKNEFSFNFENAE